MNPACDARASAAVGRTARLELVFEARSGRTVATHAYAEPPFRIGRIFDIGSAAYAIVVCTGPGIFAGDAVRQSVRVGRGARVMLASQSALQVHPGPAASPARISYDCDVDEDGELHCQWDAVIPFAGARVEQRFAVRLASTSRLFWSDALMAGRVARGETWALTDLAHELRMEVAPAGLTYLERYRLTPRDRGVERPWMAGSARYLSTVLIRHPRATAAAAEALHVTLGAPDEVHAAVDAIDQSLIAARLAAHTGPPFARARAALRSAALEAIFGSPELVARK